jgi:hypothetical protein
VIREMRDIANKGLLGENPAALRLIRVRANETLSKKEEDDDP